MGEPASRMARAAFEASLPRAAYVDEAFLDREGERLWWRGVGCGRPRGAASPMRRTSSSVDVAGERVIVGAQLAAGLSAHYGAAAAIAACNFYHVDQRLRPGERRRVIFVASRASSAAYHSWCYELDGAVRNAP